MSNIQKAVQRFRRRTGIEYVAHDFRRSAATHMAEIGIGHHIIKLILNHIDGKDVTSIYNRYEYLQEKASALQLWADHLCLWVSTKAPIASPLNESASVTFSNQLQ